MNKYQKLVTNTVLFALGTFGSKLLVYLLMPFYTRVLTPTDYGTSDLIVQMSNLISPIISVGITNGIIRFGLDAAYDKRQVFSTGFFTTLLGALVFVLFWPLLTGLEIDGRALFGEHTAYIYAYVIMSTLRAVCSQFIRAMKRVRLYTIDGVLSTLTVVLFNILFLSGFKLGIHGYLLATILSDFLSVLFLFWANDLGRFLGLRYLRRNPVVPMLRYSIPMIPNTVFWWVTNVSDRYMVAWLIDEASNGLYAASYKIPTIVTLVSGIFMDAWQISAVSEYKRSREKFFSKVFASYQAIVFLVMSGLILCAKLIMFLMVAPDYYDAWKYVPFLVLATGFSCLVTFLGSIYMVQKNSPMALFTTVVGAVANVVANLALIPDYGPGGAAFATFLSYLVVLILRGITTRRYIRLRWNLGKFLLCSSILLVQCWVMLWEPPFWIPVEILLCFMVLVMNLRPLLQGLFRILEKRRPKRPGRAG